MNGKKPPPETHPGRILLVCLNNLGDCILFLPVAAALRERYPYAHMALLTSPVGAEVAALTGLFDELVVPRRRQTGPKARYRASALLLAGRVRRGRYDVAVMASGESSYVSALLLLGGVKVRVGFDDCKLRWLLTHRVVARSRENEARRNARLLGALGLPAIVKRPPCRTSPEMEMEAGRRLADARVPERGETPRVLVHPGSARVNRRWSVSRHGELCRRLLDERVARPILLEGPAETGLAERVRDAAGVEVPILRGLGSVGVLAAAMKEMDLFVGHSTGTLHLAALVGLPSVSLWGVSDPVVWGPAWDKELHAVIVSPEAPPEGAEPEEDSAHPCMDAISVEAVLAAVREQIGKGRNR